MPLLDYLNPNVAKVKPYEPGRPIEEVARELGLDPAGIVKMASNECPLGVSPKALRAMKASLKEMNLYPDGGAFNLRQRIARLHDVKPGQLIFGNGSNELLEFIAHCFLTQGTSAVMSQYAFVVYKLLSIMSGAEPLEAPMKDFTHNLRKMASMIRKDTRVVFVCNPNNPTSTMVTSKQVEKFMARVPSDVLVVFDEAYAEIAMKRMPDTLSYVREGRNVIILRTFSKAYGLAGLRVGYGITTPEIAAALEKPRQAFNVNRMAQIAALAAVEDAAFVRRSRRTYREGSRKIMDACGRLGLEFVPPTANFILIKVGNGKKVFDALQRMGVIVRPMAPYDLPEWVRVSIGTAAENERFVTTLADVMSKTKGK